MTKGADKPLPPPLPLLPVAPIRLGGRRSRRLLLLVSPPSSPQATFVSDKTPELIRDSLLPSLPFLLRLVAGF